MKNAFFFFFLVNHGDICKQRETLSCWTVISVLFVNHLFFSFRAARSPMEPGGMSHRSHLRGQLWGVSLCSVLGLPSVPSSLLWLHKTIISLLTRPRSPSPQQEPASLLQPPSCSSNPVPGLLRACSVASGGDHSSSLSSREALQGFRHLPLGPLSAPARPTAHWPATVHSDLARGGPFCGVDLLPELQTLLSRPVSLARLAP